MFAVFPITLTSTAEKVLSIASGISTSYTKLKPGRALFFKPSNEPPMVNDLQKTLRETDSSVRQKVTIYV